MSAGPGLDVEAKLLARRARGRAGARGLRCSSRATGSATASSWSGSRARRSAPRSRGRRELQGRAARRCARSAARSSARIHAIDMKTTARRRCSNLSRRSIRAQDAAAYLELDTPQPMIDFTAVAARRTCRRIAALGAGAQRFPERQLHGRSDEGRRRGARLGACAYRRSDARSRLDLHAFVAVRRHRQAGRRLRRLRRSVRGYESVSGHTVDQTP